MLRSLTVKNLAIVEKAIVEFEAGLNVITGETGAGKSVLMGALSLVLGGRAESSQVRDGASEAEVEADFDGRIVRRTVTREGRSRAWVDDESVSIAELRELGESLVDIHGPRANQRLLEESFQRDALDDFGGVDLHAYAEAYSRLMELKARYDAIGAPLGEEELDFLRFQIGELEDAALSEEDETLAERHAAAAHAQEIIEDANAVTEALGGDRGAAEILIALQPKFAAMSRHLSAADVWRNEAEDLTLRVQELSRAVADAVSKFDTGEESLDELDSRLTLVNRLKRKYRVESVRELIAIGQEKRAKLEAEESRETRLAKLRDEMASADRAVLTAGAALTKRRQAAAKKLATAVTDELHGLGFLRARFSVVIVAAEPTATGMDRVSFYFEPNPGEEARPLAEIASSGEIARVMLALKSVTAAHTNQIQTLVFDEIDANVGGEVGKAVGERMRKVAEGRQVIAITHLPQCAVYGQRHLVVVKGVAGGRTRTKVSEVKGESRVDEIARMLGGEKLTSVVRKHAEELLEIPG